MRKIDECDMEKFGTPDRREKTIAMLGDRSWPQTSKQEGNNITHFFLLNIRKKRNERPIVRGVYWGRNGAPSRKGCVVNGEMTKASNK